MTNVTLTDLELRYDGAIPAAALATIAREAPGPGATDAEIAGQIAANMDDAAARKRAVALAIVAAAEAGQRGVDLAGRWYAANAYRAKQARAYLADPSSLFTV